MDWEVFGVGLTQDRILIGGGGGGRSQFHNSNSNLSTVSMKGGGKGTSEDFI